MNRDFVCIFLCYFYLNKVNYLKSTIGFLTDLNHWSGDKYTSNNNPLHQYLLLQQEVLNEAIQKNTTLILAENWKAILWS